MLTEDRKAGSMSKLFRGAAPLPQCPGPGYSWTACTDDACLAHVDEKEGGNWFPQPRAARAGRNGLKPSIPARRRSDIKIQEGIDGEDAPNRVNTNVLADFRTADGERDKPREKEMLARGPSVDKVAARRCGECGADDCDRAVDGCAPCRDWQEVGLEKWA
ncbi:uncharacterized protein PAC_15238 [Phialocephala subalpina]|uniref:Uncharacterized protein n=1 Tax=Phialocephala subalpina TaxID=576137 RepID=A0A1L7XK00_9HELO|nr:uncharacterized protein PAC_15238 [Phialocephala subalpina]